MGGLRTAAIGTAAMIDPGNIPNSFTLPHINNNIAAAELPPPPPPPEDDPPPPDTESIWIDSITTAFVFISAETAISNSQSAAMFGLGFDTDTLSTYSVSVTVTTDDEDVPTVAPAPSLTVTGPIVGLPVDVPDARTMTFMPVGATVGASVTSDSRSESGTSAAVQMSTEASFDAIRDRMSPDDVWDHSSPVVTLALTCVSVSVVKTHSGKNDRTLTPKKFVRKFSGPSPYIRMTAVLLTLIRCR